jgi:hypothetical protein
MKTSFTAELNGEELATYLRTMANQVANLNNGQTFFMVTRTNGEEVKIELDKVRLVYQVISE